MSVPDIEDIADAVVAQIRTAAAMLARLRQAPGDIPLHLHTELLGYVQGLHDLAGDIEAFGSTLAAEVGNNQDENE